eukprot:13847863-Ditylum_brightwellii.AAC.1
MGICKFPSKRDYWSTHKYMSSHAIITKFGMTWDCFNVIWQHFHVQSDTEHYQSDMHTKTEEDDDDDDELCEQTMEKVQRDEE